MKAEYEHCIEIGNSLIEVLNPVTGDIEFIATITNWDVDSKENLHITGIDLTKFFVDNKFISSTISGFETNFISYIQKSKSITKKFSKHYPYVIISR